MSGSQSPPDAASSLRPGRGRAALPMLSSVLTVIRINPHEAIRQFPAFRKDKTVACRDEIVRLVDVHLAVDLTRARARSRMESDGVMG
jgi:hypothetical protein